MRPAIDQGIDVSAYLPTAVFPDFDFDVDIDGNPRNQGTAPDLGASERDAE
ncbi:MAG: hypothetical protein GY854_28555 [Deltaproteobacteria bacterium]|nr:hypothetical protein [Deltaproteobacteria bacterium]